MSLERVCQTFDLINGTRSRTQKEAYLAQLRDDPETAMIARQLLAAGLNWDRNYHIATVGKNIPDHPSIVETGVDNFLNMLKRLEEGDTRGNEARNFVDTILSTYPPEIRKWLRVILLKNPKMGVSYKTVNKVWPNLIETFEVMLAETITDPGMINYPVLVEIKVDGVRVVATVGPEFVRFTSRGGKPLYNCEEIGKRLQVHCYQSDFDLGKGVVIDGELFVNNLQDTLSVVRTSVNEPRPDLVAGLKLHAFDMMWKADWDSQFCPHAQLSRTEGVANVFPTMDKALGDKTVAVAFEGDTKPRIAHNKRELEKAYDEALAAGAEGLMIKSIQSKYCWGRSNAWYKFKPDETDAFEICGYYRGHEGRNEDRLGGFQVKVPTEFGEMIVCNVGGGYSDEQRDTFWEHRDAYIGHMINVKYKMKTPDENLREPVFAGFPD